MLIIVIKIVMQLVFLKMSRISKLFVNKIQINLFILFLLENINKNSFNYQYVIGKGGFGKV